MMQLVIALMHLSVPQVAPDELIAIHCTGSSSESDDEKSTPAIRPLDFVLILDEHDRIITKWDEHTGRSDLFCDYGIKGCSFDYSPGMIYINSNFRSDPHWLGWIDRKTGKLHILKMDRGTFTSLDAQCSKVPMPKFDTTARAF